jgi:hypothetical protein
MEKVNPWDICSLINYVLFIFTQIPLKKHIKLVLQKKKKKKREGTPNLNVRKYKINCP